MRSQAASWHYDECLHFPRGAIRFPIELHPPPGFQPDIPATWPQVPGRLEYVGGRIEYIPPCGDVQQDVCMDVAALLVGWVRGQPQFVVGGNEAGMVLGGDVRAADAAVWRRADVGPSTGRFRRAAPVLAVEVAGQEEGEAELREKARWYLEHGVQLVWLVLPDVRTVVVVTAAGETRHGLYERLAEHPNLPALSPHVADFFLQLGPQSVTP